MIPEASAKWIMICGLKVYANFTETAPGHWQGSAAQFGAGAEADDYDTCERLLRHNIVSKAETWLEKAVSGRDLDREVLESEKKVKARPVAPKPAEDAIEPPAEASDKPTEKPKVKAKGKGKGGKAKTSKSDDVEYRPTI